MGHGERLMRKNMCKALPKGIDVKQYYNNVFEDFRQVIDYYPFSKLFIHPTVQPMEIKIVSVAVAKDITEALNACPNDFLGEYSKLIEVIVPYNYKKNGCKVFGGAWIDLNRIDNKDMHFFERLNDGRYKLCVGVPQSFEKMKNVLLESIRTTDNLLIAYEKIQSGLTNKLELIAYNHGKKGMKQYDKDRKKYELRG